MAKKKKPSRPRVWMLMPRQEDVDYLVGRFHAKGPLWDQWEIKLYRHSILIYTPVVPWGEDHKPDPARRFMALHLRIVPDHPGPFLLEWRRHNDRWAPPLSRGTIAELADVIEANPICHPLGQFDMERGRAAP